MFSLQGNRFKHAAQERLIDDTQLHPGGNQHRQDEQRIAKETDLKYGMRLGATLHHVKEL